MKPSTKDKQRRHIERLIAIVENEPQRPSMKMLLFGLHELRNQMRNRAETPRGRIVSDPVTPAKIAEVKAIRAAHPHISQQEIAHRTNVNIGRVSEILHGKRT